MITELGKFGIRASYIEISFGETYDFKKVIQDNIQSITKDNLKAVCIAIDKVNISKMIISIGFAF